MTVPNTVGDNSEAFDQSVSRILERVDSIQLPCNDVATEIDRRQTIAISAQKCDGRSLNAI